MTLSVDVHASPLFQSLGLEATARTLRYQAISAWMQENLPSNAALLLAHHANDQAETLLLQLMRGAGPKGLASMPMKKTVKGIHMVRPLLNYAYQELQAYARHHRLEWVDDPSNQDIRFDRNFIRHDIMPRLIKRWPQAVNNMQRAAQHCADQTTLLDGQLLALIPPNNHASNELPLSVLQDCSQIMGAAILRTWLSQSEISMPSTAKLNEALRQLCEAKSDKNPCVIWGGIHSLRRYQQTIYYVPVKRDNVEMRTVESGVQWDIRNPLDLGNGSLLVVNDKGKDKEVTAKLISSAVLTDMKVSVVFRQGGEKIILNQDGQHHSVKKLMQLWKVPPWLRRQWPLIMVDNVLAAIPSLNGKKCHVSHAMTIKPEYQWLSTIQYLRK